MNTFTEITKTEIQNSAAITSAAKIWAIENLEYLNKPMKLFGSSLKVEKGAHAFETYVMYLQPADKVAAVTICAGAKMAGCKKPCLISSGQLGMTVGQNAATKRTILLLLRGDWFNAQLLREIDAAEKKSEKPGNKPALFRLNGASDLDWSHIINARPNSNFYDYTKIEKRLAKKSSNYSVTFSASMYSEQSRRAFRRAVINGEVIAVAFNTKNLASDQIQIPNNLENFDKTDLRNLDAPKTIGALTRKGSSKKSRALENESEKSFFVTAKNYADFSNIIASAK